MALFCSYLSEPLLAKHLGCKLTIQYDGIYDDDFPLAQSSFSLQKRKMAKMACERRHFENDVRLFRAEYFAPIAT